MTTSAVLWIVKEKNGEDEKKYYPNRSQDPARTATKGEHALTYFNPFNVASFPFSHASC